MTKLDTHLAKIMSAPQNPNINCLVYSHNLAKLAHNINKQQIKITGLFPFINAIAICAPKTAIVKIANLSFVDFLASQTQVFAMMNVANKILGTANIKPQPNTTIAYIDTGIFPHLDFLMPQNRLVKFVDLINYRLNPYDDNGHGTFVAGAGSGNGFISSGKFAGVCPKSKIIAIKALNAEGEANSVKILEAMQWVYDNHKKYNIRVVCMSFGSEPLGQSDPIMQGAEKLWEQNIIVVAAAGNSGPQYETIKSPGISSKIITVGGFDDNRLDDNTFDPNFFEIADFSSCGPAFNRFKPDVVAPAVNITSCGISSHYTKLSGTSVATPMIAGLCAVLTEKNPAATATEIKKQLLTLGVPITFNKNKEGSGFATFN